MTSKPDPEETSEPPEDNRFLAAGFNLMPPLSHMLDEELCDLLNMSSLRNVHPGIPPRNAANFTAALDAELEACRVRMASWDNRFIAPGSDKHRMVFDDEIDAEIAEWDAILHPKKTQRNG